MFINQDLSSENETLTEREAKRYFDENRDKYYISPVMTFTHVFFESRNRGREQAKQMAAVKLVELNKKQVPFDEGARHGDRFLYYVNYVERSPEFIASHFGPEMAREILKLHSENNRWYGPYESPYGFHLVMVSMNSPGRSPEFDEISARVREDARQAKIKNKSETIIKEIVDSYRVQKVFTGLEPVNEEKTGVEKSDKNSTDMVKDQTDSLSAVAERVSS